MEKFKLYLLNNKRIFIMLGSLFAIMLCCLGCFFYYQDNQNEEVIDEVIFSDLENDVNSETELQNKNDSNLENDKQNNLLDSNQDNNNDTQKEEVIEYIYVDIKGYVNKPGVYKVEKNSNKRIHDLITLAGGLKKDADTSIINLSTKLKDEMVVIIYSKKELEDFVKTKETLNNKVDICEKEEVKNNACICEDDINNNFDSNNSNNEENKDNSQNNNPNNNETSSKININTASLELLMTLPGIGESKAKAIIDYRNEVGLFLSIEDIKNVSGIGDSAFEKIKDSITVK